MPRGITISLLLPFEDCVWKLSCVYADGITTHVSRVIMSLSNMYGKTKVEIKFICISDSIISCLILFLEFYWYFGSLFYSIAFYSIPLHYIPFHSILFYSIRDMLVSIHIDLSISQKCDLSILQRSNNVSCKIDKSLKYSVLFHPILQWRDIVVSLYIDISKMWHFRQIYRVKSPFNIEIASIQFHQILQGILDSN